MNPLSHDDWGSPVYRRELEEGFKLLKKLDSLKNMKVFKPGDTIRIQQIHPKTKVYLCTHLKFRNLLV